MLALILFDYIISSISVLGTVRISQVNKSLDWFLFLFLCLSEAGGVGVLTFTFTLVASQAATENGNLLGNLNVNEAATSEHS